MNEEHGSAIEAIEDISDYSRWRLEIRLAEEAKKTFDKRADELMREFTAQKTNVEEMRTDQPFNIFWSNVQTLQPAVYSLPPNVIVDRRRKDKNPVGRVASIVLERACQYCVDEEDFHPTMLLCRDDWLRVALGVTWNRYQPTMDESGQVVYEEAPTDYVHFRDFLASPARIWKEVRWVARITYLSREELRGRFGEILGDEVEKVGLDYTSSSIAADDDARKHDVFKRSKVYEIWDRQSKKVYWLSKEYDNFLDVKDDPLHLRGFFPCPQPLFATQTSDTIWPMADFLMYQMLADQLNSIALQIDDLIEAVRVAGVYDESCEGIEQLLNSDARNTLIPVKNMTMFRAAGGFSGAMAFMPMTDIVNALNVLYQAQEHTLQRLYQVSGMSDLLRGTSDPRETATAQSIKGRFATLRLDEKKRQIDRFVRDNIKIKAEIIAEHFAPETLRVMTGIDFLHEFAQDPESAEMIYMQAIELLRSDELRCYTIDIETDSTIALDENEEKETATALVSSIGGFLESAMKVIEVQPHLGNLVGEMLMYIVRRHRGGKNLESVVEDAITQMQEMAKQPQQQQAPDPAVMKVQQDGQIKQAEMQMRQAEMQQDTQIKQAELQLKQQELAIKREALAIEAQKVGVNAEEVRAKLEIENRKIEAETSVESAKLNAQMQAAMLKAEVPPMPRASKKVARFTTDPQTGDRIAVVEEMQ